MTVGHGLDDAESARIFAVYRDRRDGDVGHHLPVIFDHFGDVHPVDVIGTEDRDDIRLGLFDEVDVLVDGVRRAAIPGLPVRAHLRRHGDDELIAENVAELPTVLQMQQERLALELHQDVDGKDAGVDEIAENEIDDPVLAAKGHGRLGAFVGQRR